MSLFKPATNTMAFAKVGLLGFAGSGKTRTAWEIAKGLHDRLESKKPVAFLDTETGSDFVIPLAKKAGIELLVSKTRAFKDLMPAMREAETAADILIIDSVTHYWVDLVESYRKKKQRDRLAFQDWGVIKPMWAEFSQWFVMSNTHCIVCGRAGFEYDYFEGDDGKMELYKSGTKMKAEGEFGFEPSLLIEMERLRNPEATDEYRSARGKTDKDKAARKILEERTWVRRAWVLKDRADVLDGRSFDNPDFSVFAPHWDFLNIGGKHQPIESGDSQAMFDDAGRPDWKKRDIERKKALETVEGILVELWPGSGKTEKACKALLVRLAFGTRSWTDVENRSLADLQQAVKRLESFVGRWPEHAKGDPEKDAEVCWSAVMDAETAEIHEGDELFAGTETAPAPQEPQP